MNKEQTANASAENNNNNNNNNNTNIYDVDDWCEREERPSVKWTPLILHVQGPDMTERGNNNLSVALGELVYSSTVFLFVPDILKEGCNAYSGNSQLFSMELNSSKGDLLTFMHCSGLWMHPSMKKAPMITL